MPKLLFGALFVAVSTVTATVGSLAEAAQSSSEGTVVRLPFPQDDGSLTPYSFELGYPLMTLVYDTLMWRDEAGVPQPWLADAVDTAPDGRQVTSRMAAGARWHDGVPVTAEDVAFTFRFVGDRPHPRFTPELSAVRRVEVADPSTVVVRLEEPAPGFLDQPLADMPILPAHLWSDLPAGQAAPEGLPVGSGPYRLVEHRPGQGYRFEANDGYFRGAPAVRTLEVPVIDRAEEMLRALERRRVDMVPVSLPAEDAQRVRGLGVRVVDGPSYLGTVLALNVRQPPFDRRAVRQALAKALDLRRISRAVGEAVPADRGYLHPDSGWSSPEPVHVYDEAAARAELAALGLPPVEVLAPDNDPVKLEAARRVVLALRTAGLEATSRAVSRGDLSRAVGEDGSAPTFQAAIRVAFPLASHDPSFLARVFGSDPSEAPFNETGYASAAFDGLARRIMTTVDPGARRAAVVEGLRVLADDLPVIPLFFSNGTYTYRPTVHDGWVFVKGSGILDKQSFLAGSRREPGGGEPEGPPQDPEPGRDGGLPLGPIALGLAGLAVAMGLVGLARRRM